MALVSAFSNAGPTVWASRDPSSCGLRTCSAGLGFLEKTSTHWTLRSVGALRVFYVIALYKSIFTYLLTYSQWWMYEPSNGQRHARTDVLIYDSIHPYHAL